jgi:hypothetical protein
VLVDRLDAVIKLLGELVMAGAVYRAPALWVAVMWR